jgi:carboxypeptidase family protein
MTAKASKLALPAILTCLFSAAFSLQPQTSASGLSGSITSTSGVAVSAASVSAKNLNTGESAQTQTDAAGHFSLPQLAPGDYEVSVTAPGFSNLVVKTMLAPGVGGTIDLALSAQAPAPGNLPNAPSSSQTEPSLSDLGFTPEQTQSNAKEQALLDKRTRMLKTHQKLGLITVAPLVATVVTSLGAGGKKTSNTDRTVHLVLGAVSGDLYFTTAYFAIRAPSVKGTHARGPIRVHKALAWIHGPGMILSPILGALAYEEKNKGEHVHGLASAHGPVAIVTAGAFGAALLSVSTKF